MEIKLFEIRDTATFMPVMAIRLEADLGQVHEDQIIERERFLLRRAGYGEEQILTPVDGNCYVILVKLDGTEAQYDPYNWPNRRTLPVAHQHMIDNWRKLTSGDVIDVEYLLKETERPKVSEQILL